MMEESKFNSPDRYSLPVSPSVIQTVFEAFYFIFKNIGAVVFIFLMTFPAGFLIDLTIGSLLNDYVMRFLNGFFSAFITVFVIVLWITHITMSLNFSNFIDCLPITKQMARYYLIGFFIFVFPSFPMLPAVLPIFPLETRMILLKLGALISFILMVVSVRWIFFFPGGIFDPGYNLKRSWKDTNGLSIKLIMSFFFSFFPVIFPFILIIFSDIIFHSPSSLARFLSEGIGSIIIGAASILSYFSFIYCVVEYYNWSEEIRKNSQTSVTKKAQIR